MHLCAFKFTIFFSTFLIHFSSGTIDINFAEYQYLSDHLTERECHLLVAALHFHSFELPKDINAAERRLPENVPCIDLLLHWNSAPREGKGQTHTEVCHRLNQIGREDLAQWLSKTVFHELGKDLKVALTASEADDATLKPANVREIFPSEKVIDEAAWWKIDSLLEILIVIGLTTLAFGSFFLCFLCLSKSKECSKGYSKLSANEN